MSESEVNSKTRKNTEQDEMKIYNWKSSKQLLIS